MDAKRIIPILELADGRVAGAGAADPAESAGRLAQAGADGILFREGEAGARATRWDWVRAVAGTLFIPFALEVPLARMLDLEALLEAGADKVVLDAAGTALLEAAAARFGRAHVAVALEAAPEADPGTLVAHMAELAQRGAGEILLRADGVAALGPLFQRAAQLQLAVVFRSDGDPLRVAEALLHGADGAAYPAGLRSAAEWKTLLAGQGLTLRQ
jgi:imidazole glycerol phosphate synthase subunit HisF